MKHENLAHADDQLSYSVTPHTILPSQFFMRRTRPSRLVGEYRLLLAILEDAIHIYCQEAAAGRSRSRLREAEGWIWSSDRDWIFSFERVCEALNIDPDYLRRGLTERRWRALGVRWVPETANGQRPARAVGW